MLGIEFYHNILCGGLSMGKLDDILSNSAIPKVNIAIYMPFAHLQENGRTKIKKVIFHVFCALHFSTLLYIRVQWDICASSYT